MRRKGLTFIELLTVMGIIGIGSAMFYSFFFVNSVSYDAELTMLELQQQVDEIFWFLEQDVMEAEVFNLTSSRNAVLSYPPALNKTAVSYLITGAGELRRTSGTGSSSLSLNVDTANSGFQQSASNNLVFRINLVYPVLGRNVTYGSIKNFYLRN